MRNIYTDTFRFRHERYVVSPKNMYIIGRMACCDRVMSPELLFVSVRAVCMSDWAHDAVS